MKDFAVENFDKLLVALILAAFLILLPYSAGDTAKFVEQSANLTLGCLLGLVTSLGKNKG